MSNTKHIKRKFDNCEVILNQTDLNIDEGDRVNIEYTEVINLDKTNTERAKKLKEKYNRLPVEKVYNKKVNNIPVNDIAVDIKNNNVAIIS